MGLIENVRYLMQKDEARDTLSEDLIKRLLTVEQRLSAIEDAPTVTVSTAEAGHVEAKHDAKTAMKTTGGTAARRTSGS